MYVGKINIFDQEFQFDFVRSPGAGGQNVNKVNSKAVLHWNVVNSPSLAEPVRQRFLKLWARRVTLSGDVVITSSRYRDQLKNKQDVLDKLAEMIKEVAFPPTKRKKTKPTKGSKERRLKKKKIRSETKLRRKRHKCEDE